MTVAKESLPAVTIAGVVAIVFGLFGALGSLLGAVSFLLMPQLPARPGAPAMPQGVQMMSAAMILFFFAVAVFGIFVGVGVLRRRNWARISILIWGGLMAFFCLAAVAFSLVIFSVMPSLNLPNARAADTHNAMLFIRFFLLVFYGVPAGVGIWWLVLFTRKRVSNAFTASGPSAPSLDASGFPQITEAAPPQPPRPSCPLPLAVVAVLAIFGGASLLLFVFMPLASDFPLIAFGHAFAGSAPKLILALFGLVSGVAGFGILKLKPWALYTEIVLQSLGLANCLVTFFSPNYAPLMRSAMEKIYGENPLLTADSPFLSDTYLRSTLILAFVFVFAVLAILLWQRPRFLEQAAEADG